MKTEEILTRVKDNLILTFDDDDKLLLGFITAAISYAEEYQHLTQGFYSEHEMPETTVQAIVMLSTHFYESRDGSTAGFFSDHTGASDNVWTTVNRLLVMNREWKV